MVNIYSVGFQSNEIVLEVNLLLCVFELFFHFCEGLTALFSPLLA